MLDFIVIREGHVYIWSIRKLINFGEIRLTDNRDLLSIPSDDNKTNRERLWFFMAN